MPACLPSERRSRRRARSPASPCTSYGWPPAGEADQYELSALAALAGTPNPRALAGLVRLAAASLLRKASIPEVLARLRALEITADGDGLTVRGLKLSEPELLALLQGALLPRAAGDADARRGD